MAQDVKLFNACDHNVDNIRYEQPLCPRCYGRGYYFDIHFDMMGKAVLSNGSIKLQQETLKILVDEKYTNVFHKEWGSQVNNLVGTKNLYMNKSKLEVLVRNALDHLKNVQINEMNQWGHLTEEEILDKILFVEINQLGPTGYNIDITISNKTGEILQQSIIL